MTLFLSLLTLAVGQPPAEPPVIFQACRQTKLHIAVQRHDAQTDLVHFHVRFRQLGGKMAFARLRCEVQSEGSNTTTHLSTKNVPIKVNDESWTFYFYVQRFPAIDAEKVTYQIEVGELAPSELDDYKVRDSFAWRFRDGKMFVGSEKNPVFIPIPVRRIVVEGGKYRIVTEMAAEVRVTTVRYGIVIGLAGPSSMAGSAEREKN